MDQPPPRDELQTLDYASPSLPRYRTVGFALVMAILFTVGAFATFIPGGLHGEVSPLFFGWWAGTGIVAIPLVLSARRGGEVIQETKMRRILPVETRVATVLAGLALIVGLISVVGPRPDAHGSPYVRAYRCEHRLQLIGQAMMLYSNENQHRLPPTFKELIQTEDAFPEDFVCDATDDTPAPGATPQQRADALDAGGHLSYVYLGAGLTNNEPVDVVLACEPLSHHGDAGANVMFGDFHVDLLKPSEARVVWDQVAAGTRPVRYPRPAPRPAPPPPTTASGGKGGPR